LKRGKRKAREKRESRRTKALSKKEGGGGGGGGRTISFFREGKKRKKKRSQFKSLNAVKVLLREKKEKDLGGERKGGIQKPGSNSLVMLTIDRLIRTTKRKGEGGTNCVKGEMPSLAGGKK